MKHEQQQSQRPLTDYLRPAGGMARALHFACRGNLRRMECGVLAELLRPLVHLVDELEVVCAGSEWADFAEQNNRYLSALLEVLDTNCDQMEPGWFADLLTPILVKFDLLDDQLMGSGQE